MGYKSEGAFGEQAMSSHLYRKGVDAWTMRGDVRNRTKVNTARRFEPRTVSRRIDVLIDQREKIKNRWARLEQPQPDHERKAYLDELNEYEVVIRHLESLVDNGFMRHLLDGNITAFGYCHESPSLPLPIPTNEWAFMTLNFKDSTATGESLEYRAIRFFWTEQLENEEKEALQAVFAERALRQSGGGASDAENPRNRKTRLRVAIEEAYDRVVALHNGVDPGTNDEVIRLLVTDDQTGAITDSDDKYVWWSDRNGDSKRTSRKSIANTLGEIRNAKNARNVP